MKRRDAAKAKTVMRGDPQRALERGRGGAFLRLPVTPPFSFACLLMPIHGSRRLPQSVERKREPLR